MLKRSRGDPTIHFKLMTFINKTTFALAPFAVALGIAAIYATAAVAYSSTATCSTDFGVNVICRTTW